MEPRIHALSLMLLLPLLGTGCRRPPAPSGSYPAFVTTSLEAHPDGSFRKGRLREPTQVEGLPCRGWVHRQPNGRLLGVELDEEVRVAGHTVPAGTQVWYREDGTPKTLALSRTVEVSGYHCRGGMKIHTGLHPGGELEYFFPPDDLEIDGVACAATLFQPVRLDEDGHLVACRLARDLRSGDRLLRAGEDVRKDSSGAWWPR